MSVALRTITRLQDADDINVTPGAGVDEYALCWDNDTAKFVLRQMSAGVTDHGALTGLADDDHTQYLLATGARTGASSQAQTFTNGIIGPTWKPASDSATALQIQRSGGTPLVTVDTTNKRMGIGTTAPNSTLHVQAEDNLTATFSRGTNAMFSFGNQANYIRFISSAHDFGSYKDFMLETVDGGTMYLTAAGLVGIGTTAPSTKLHVLLSSEATNAVTNVVTISHNTTGTAAAGYGSRVLWELESSTTADTTAAGIYVLWNDATHASRKADLVLTAYDSGGEREGLRIRGDGSGPALGFYGVAPIARAVLATGAGATVDNVITALQNLGLVKQS